MRYPLIRGHLRSAILRWLRPMGLRTAFEASAAEPLCRYQGNLAALGRKPAHDNYCVSIYLYPVRISLQTTALPVRDRIGCARPGKSTSHDLFLRGAESIVWVQVIFWIKPIGEWMGRPVTGRVGLCALMGKLVVGRQRGVPPCVAHSLSARSRSGTVHPGPSVGWVPFRSELSGQIHHRDKLAAVPVETLSATHRAFLDHYVIASWVMVVPGGNSNHRLVGRQISPSCVGVTRRCCTVWMYGATKFTFLPLS